MPIDASKVQWDAPTIDLNAVQWDDPSQTEIPGPRQAGFLTRLGRTAASLADVTVGGLLPAAAQQIAYPLARLGRSPTEAQAATQRVVSAVDQPFGKAFGVSETPEYQQESTRQLLGFIGENFQKGAKWIAKQTGLPASDVENMMGTLTFAAPAAARPIVQVTKDVVAPGLKLAADQTASTLKKPFEKQLEARRERLSEQDYARGPQIDAAAQAQRMGLVIDPSSIQPTLGPKLTKTLAGEKGQQAAFAANQARVREIQLNDMGMPKTAALNDAKTFDQAKTNVAGPYQEVAQLPIMMADDAVRANLERLRPDESIVGSNQYAASINSIIDDAVAKTNAGLNGAQLLESVSKARERARKTYNNKSATSDQLDIADTNLAVANALESMVESNIANPKLLDRWRDARQKMARIYAYEGATNLNTGLLDVNKLSRITSKDNVYTGDIAALGQVAGNFPSAFQVKPPSNWGKAAALGRTGLAGTLGGVAGYYGVGGGTAAAVGSLLGATVGELGQRVMANRLASPTYQAGLTLRDMRIPVNQLASVAAPIPQNRAMVPYQPEVLGSSGEGAANPLRIVGYDENDRPIYAPARQGSQQGFTMPPQPHFGAAPTPYAQRSLPNEVPRQIYEAQKRAELAQEFRARDERKPAGRGVELMFDNAGNLIPVPTSGAGGVMPSALESAVAKMSGQMVFEPRTQYETVQTGSYLNRAPMTETRALEQLTLTPAEAKKYVLPTRQGQAFAMTAEEKIAWNKAKADLAEVAPGFKALDDKAIASKMMDRAWVEQTAAKVREKAAAFEQIAARAANERARQSAMANRERMLDLAEQMDETLRTPRPTSTGGQGPKTRAFQRNKLNMLSDQDVVNQLLQRP